ncbi:beta-adaptin A-like protein, partial [Trifolium medium]|nr:beta-adaptin A-like protein [Trifolium medium]
MRTAVANESNTCEMVTELCEDAANVDISIARESIWVVVKMVLQQYDVNVVVVPIIQFLEMERGYAISNALKFATTRLNSSVRVMPWDPGKFYAFMAKVVYECYWRNSLSIYGLLNWVDGRYNHFQPLPSGLNEVWRLADEPAEAMDIRRNEQGKVEVLVKGRRLPTFENSWEPEIKVHREFSGFLLEDKESFEGGGNDR